jgi:hypothetical protein
MPSPTGSEMPAFTGAANKVVGGAAVIVAGVFAALMM